MYFLFNDVTTYQYVTCISRPFHVCTCSGLIVGDRCWLGWPIKPVTQKITLFLRLHIDIYVYRVTYTHYKATWALIKVHVPLAVLGQHFLIEQSPYKFCDCFITVNFVDP